jgi:hypothetical protein
MNREATLRRASATGRQMNHAQVVDGRHADSGPLQALVRLPDEATQRPHMFSLSIQLKVRLHNTWLLRLPAD